MSATSVILLIDGPHMVRRHYHVTTNLTDIEGNCTGGIFGFLSEVSLLARELEPDLLITVWDGGSDPWRKQMFPGYRDRTDANPVKEKQRQADRAAVDWQVNELVTKICPIIGIPCIRRLGMEADDIIYLLSSKILPQGSHKIVVSGDKDFLQLVRDDLWILNPSKKKEANDPVGLMIRPDNFHEVSDGLTPIQYLEARYLMGDDSDKVPGVHGIGEKTAAKIIKRFGGLEEALADPEGLKKLGKVPSKLLESEHLEGLSVAMNLMNLAMRPTGEDEIALLRGLLEESRGNLTFDINGMDAYCIERDALQFQADIPTWISSLQGHFDRSQILQF